LSGVLSTMLHLSYNVTAELKGQEERSKQYFDKVLNGFGGSEADEMLNEVLYDGSCFPYLVD